MSTSMSKPRLPKKPTASNLSVASLTKMPNETWAEFEKRKTAAREGKAQFQPPPPLPHPAAGPGPGLSESLGHGPSPAGCASAQLMKEDEERKAELQVQKSQRSAEQRQVERESLIRNQQWQIEEQRGQIKNLHDQPEAAALPSPPSDGDAVAGLAEALAGLQASLALDVKVILTPLCIFH